MLSYIFKAITVYFEVLLLHCHYHYYIMSIWRMMKSKKTWQSLIRPQIPRYFPHCLPVPKNLSMALQPLWTDIGRFFSFLIYTQSVGLLVRGISQSQGQPLCPWQSRLKSMYPQDTQFKLLSWLSCYILRQANMPQTNPIMWLKYHNNN
jgi:hypothetical protein